MYDNSEDIAVIQQVLRGDTRRFAVLVERYQGYVFTLTMRYIKNRETAEEVGQDVFVKAYKALVNFKSESKFSTWLFTITTNTCLSFLRKKELETASLDNEKLFERADNIDGGLNANVIEQKSRQRMVAEAISLLSPEDAQVITLFYKAEQTLEEIAGILGKEPNAVKVQLHRARTRLKDKMQQHFKEEVKDIY
jgi:RNA polymerase sigma factor (sigma-70 family)